MFLFFIIINIKLIQIINFCFFPLSQVFRKQSENTFYTSTFTILFIPLDIMSSKNPSHSGYIRLYKCRSTLTVWTYLITDSEKLMGFEPGSPACKTSAVVQ
uniref:Uncharacterized protein n=1 Tax=Cacopsylla melanoneura TaxID=428564 RepID=A0A8D8XY41_9HEMI